MAISGGKKFQVLAPRGHNKVLIRYLENAS